MFIRNALALIGLVVVCKKGYELFDKHLRVPLERAVTDAVADEQTRKS
jgi:hypothetical protein